MFHLNSIIIAFVIVSVQYSSLLITEGLLLTVNQGMLNGTYARARNGTLFNAFYGIPFAKPPIGELRLKAPVAADPWNGIFDATRTPVGCLELADDGNGTKGDEDCLNLNVYTPLGARKGDNLPVLFYIYGGSFKINNNMDEGPEYMMTRNLILVIPNYRGGSLGFLSTGDAVIPGNFGLKDQLLALKWTRENIHNFGGNPDHVTINGHSSGAVCTHFHTLSPASKGLFQQVIMQSASAFCSLAYWGPDVSRAITKEFATKTGCPSTASSQDMYECFKDLRADIFVTLPEQMYVWSAYPDGIFRPTIEDKNVEDAFITDIPQHLSYHSPKLPWMMGLTTGEGAGMTSELLANNGKQATELNEFYKVLFPIMLQYLWNTKVEQLNNISNALKTRYFGGKYIGTQTPHELVQMITHGNFGSCVLEAIHSYPGPKYVYWYDYAAQYLAQNEVAFYDGFLGVSHSDEVNLLFRTLPSANVLNDRDIMFSEELVKRWVNFIQTSNPNFPDKINENLMEHWKPVTTDRIEYLLININGTMGTDLYHETYPFWKSLGIGSKYYSYGRS